MSSLRRFFLRIAAFLRPGPAERDMDREVSSHLALMEDEFRRRGMTPEEARLMSRREFGAVEQAKEFHREERSLPFLDRLRQDTRYTFRTLRKNPGFALVAVLTLALGIGGTTLMFSVVNGVLLHPLPYPDQDRIVDLMHQAPGVGIRNLASGPAIYFGYRDNNTVFEAVGHWHDRGGEVTVTGKGDPETVRSVEVTHEILAVLGVSPVVGHGFEAVDDLPETAPTVVISYGLWQRRFDGASDVLTHTLNVNGVSRQIIGVLPESFRFFEYPVDIFMPHKLRRSEEGFPFFSGRSVARLKKGVTVEEANRDGARIIRMLAEQFQVKRFGAVELEKAGLGPNFRLLKERVVGDLRTTLWLLMTTVGMLLLLACANVSNLVLARSQARRHELAIRAAIGAGRGSIARLLLTESLLIGLSGGVVGLALAYWTLPVLLSAARADLPDIMNVTIDGRVALFALAISVLSALILSMLPMLHLPAANLAASVQRGGRSITNSRESNRGRHALMVAQLALAFTLLIGSGLMLRTFDALRQVDPGFREPERVQTFQLTIPPALVADSEQVVRTQAAILEQIAALPGVISLALVANDDGLPMDNNGRIGSYYIEGRASTEGARPIVEVQVISPKFFETLQTPFLTGRSFEWADIYGRRPVVLVSESVARKEWGSTAAALGKRIAVRPTGPWLEIVGVMADVHHNGLTEPAPAVMAFPLLGYPSSGTAFFVVRSSRAGTAAFLRDLQNAVWSLNRELSLGKIQTLAEMYRRSMARTFITLLILAITGATALLLGLIGIYGVVSYVVTQRRREIGIRLALGARYGEVLWMFVGHALLLAGIGVAIGFVAAIALTRLMRSQLFGITPLDPLTYATVGVVLVATTALASYLPARRAATTNPVEVLQVG